MGNERIVVLTGAGVSAESGLGTFRDAGGIWERFDPYELATPEAFARDPSKVHAFYNMRRRDLLGSQPNEAHIALARAEKAVEARGGRFTIVTQNIDDLHERAGSQNVLHMHGELRKARCGACEWVVRSDTDIDTEAACTRCGAVGAMRPHVVWFNEMPLFLDVIAAELAIATQFVSIGTSGSVWPAAGFVMEARDRGVPTLELNLEPSDAGKVFDDALYGPASQIVPDWVDRLIAAPPMGEATA